jgi:hypothetical protein
VLTGEASPTDVTSKFVLERVGVTNTYIIKTAPAAYFYYGFNASTVNHYFFTISATVGAPPVSNSFVQDGYLSNVNPTITNKPTAPFNMAVGDVDIYDFNGVNGSNPTSGLSTAGLTWTVTNADGTPTTIFTITSGGLLQDLSALAEGTFNLKVTLTEASGNTDFVNITVIYPFRNSVTFTSWSSKCGTVSAIETTTGFITITGIDANFNAFATVNTGTVSITTDVTIDGTSLNAFRNTNGTTNSGILTLSAGTYPYFIEVDRVISGSGVGCGGINYIQ